MADTGGWPGKAGARDAMTFSGAAPVFTQPSMAPRKSTTLGPGPPAQCSVPGSRNMRVLLAARPPVAAFMRAL